MNTFPEMDSIKPSPIKRFWLLLRPDKYEIRNVYVYAIFIGILNLTLPIGIQAIINLIQGGAVNTSWIILVFFVTFGIALGGIMQINQLRITEILQQKIFTRAAFEFTYRIPRIKLEKLFKKYAPELMNRFFDVMTVQKSLSKILIDFSSASIQVIFGLILLSFYHPFFIIFSLLLVVMVILIIRFTAQKGMDTSLLESKRKYEIAHWLEETARANTTFKLAGQTDLPMDRVNTATNQYIDARDAHFSVLIRQYGLLVIFKVLVALGLLLIGGLLVFDQQMNIGQFVAAEIVILLVISSVEKLILSFETIYDVLTSLEKIGQVTDLELESDMGIEVVESDDGLSIDVQNVEFSYPGEVKKVINDISLKINSGQRLLITGKNDSGKSTLLYLISGLLKPQQGSISIDDIPIGNYQYNSLHSRIGGYLRDERLFEGTLLENITLGRERATFARVQEAIKNLGLLDFIKNLPMGYDTLISPDGKQFSKSTVAKILIARSIADTPRLLLLENSFSVFSPEDRISILKYLLDEDHNWTVLLTSSQDLEINSMIDRHIVLSEGKIIKQ